MPSKQQEQCNEAQIEHLSSNMQLQWMLFGRLGTAAEQKKEIEKHEQTAVCLYCRDTEPQGLPVEWMV